VTVGRASERGSGAPELGKVLRLLTDSDARGRAIRVRWTDGSEEIVRSKSVVVVWPGIETCALDAGGKRK
jgi:uncharacterized protein YwbE